MTYLDDVCLSRDALDEDDRCYWDACCEDDVHCEHYDRGYGCCECGAR